MIMYLRYWIVLMVCLAGGKVTAQQDFHYSQYMVNPYIYNPAVAGTSSDLDVRIAHRRQWANFPGAPSSYYMTAHMPFNVHKKPDPLKSQHPFHAVGIIAYQDMAGPVRKLSTQASYSYNLPLTENLRWATAISGGIVNYSLDYSKLIFDQDGETFNYDNKTFPDLTLGTWLHNQHFFAGLSLNHILHNDLNFTSNSGIENEDRNEQQPYHVYFTNGYNIPLGYAKGKGGVHSYYMVPSVMLKYAGQGTTPSFDINLKVKRTDLMWLGTSYRHRDSFVLLAGFTLLSTDKSVLEISYSYDHPINKFRGYSYGSHELVIGYRIKQKRKVMCPEDFW